jgi:hypothetical protein
MSIFLSYRRTSQRTLAIKLRELLQPEIRAIGMLSWKDVFLDENDIDLGHSLKIA